MGSARGRPVGVSLWAPSAGLSPRQLIPNWCAWSIPLREPRAGDALLRVGRGGLADGRALLLHQTLCDRLERVRDGLMQPTSKLPIAHHTTATSPRATDYGTGTHHGRNTNIIATNNHENNHTNMTRAQTQ